MKITNRTFWELWEWTFKLQETMERDYEFNIEASLLKLKEIEWEINKIPFKIEELENQKENLIKFYNEWLEVFEEAKKHYWWEFKDLEIPKKIK